MESHTSQSSDDDTYVSCSRTLSLVDEDPAAARTAPLVGDEDASPQKKRRVSSTSAPGWQDFCRKGTKFKTLLDDALEKVTTATISSSSATATTSTTSTTTSTGDNNNSSEQSTSSIAMLARQKTTENIRLQQKLDQIKSEQAQMKALNNELREAAKQQAARMQKMTTTLDLTTANAAKARNEAAEAEAAAATFETQLEALKIVVQETKRASQLLLHEQEDIAQKTTVVEQKYVQAQAELTRSKSQQTKLQQTNQELVQAKVALENQIKEWKKTVQQEREETKQWKMSYFELEVTGKTQQAQMLQLEQDVQQANNLLVEATSTAAESESTSLELKNSLEKMQNTVETLHKQLQNKQEDERNERDRKDQELAKVQQQSQALKAQIATHQDQIKQMNFEKQAHEKRVRQLQAKSSNLERRLQESTNIVTATTTTTNEFSIPPLNDKENPLPTCKCSICFKTLTTGLMKRCQCGKPNCTSRAHISCVNKITAGPSLSHPGTPAPPLPVILCSSASSRRATSIAAITPMQKGKSST